MDLDTLRKFFYAGYFSQAIEKKDTLQVSKLDEPEADALFSLCELAVARPITCTKTSSQEMTAVQAFATYLNAKSCGQSVETHVKSLKKLAGETIVDYLISAALIASPNHSDQLESLKYSTETTSELLVARIAQVLLLNHAELIEPILQQLNSSDDGGQLADLGAVIYNFAIGNYKEAYMTCCDLQLNCCSTEIEREQSELLLNQKAVASIHQGNHTEALEDLMRAYQLNAKNSTTLLNLITVTSTLDMEDDYSTYMQQLQLIQPQHDLFNQMNKLDVAFDEFRAH